MYSYIARQKKMPQPTIKTNEEEKNETNEQYQIHCWPQFVFFFFIFSAAIHLSSAQHQKLICVTVYVCALNKANNSGFAYTIGQRRKRRNIITADTTSAPKYNSTNRVKIKTYYDCLNAFLNHHIKKNKKTKNQRKYQMPIKHKFSPSSTTIEYPTIQHSVLLNIHIQGPPNDFF